MADVDIDREALRKEIDGLFRTSLATCDARFPHEQDRQASDAHQEALRWYGFGAQRFYDEPAQLRPSWRENEPHEAPMRVT